MEDSARKMWIYGSEGTETIDDCQERTRVRIPKDISGVLIPKDVVEVDIDRLFEIEGLEAVEVEAGNRKYRSVDGILYSADLSKLRLYPRSKSGEEFTIPSTVTNLCSYVFDHNKNLRILNIPGTCNLDDVDLTNETSFDVSYTLAFPCCRLEKINVDRTHPSLSSYGGVLFSKTGRTLVRWPPGLTSDSCTIPKSVYMVSPGAFAGTKIKNIVMTNITALYGYTFERSGVHSVEMPFVKSLDISEFEGCEELTEVKFSDNLRSIGECCFLKCKELGEITIPDTLTAIGPRAFEGCWNLDTIKIVQLNGNIIGKKGEARLPSRLRRVSYAAFESCSMHTLYIPNSVKSIDDYAFSHCNTLSTVIIDKTNTDALYTSIIPFGYRGTAKIIRVKDGDSFQEEKFCNGMYISYPLKKRKRY